MIYFVTFSSQGRFTIPIALRHTLGFDKVKKVKLWIKDGKIFIEPLIKG